jgi:hypothetical protein
MSIIFAAVFSDRALVAGDGRRHNALNRSEHFANVDKTRRFDSGLVGVKAGYVTDTEELWPAIETAAKSRTSMDDFRQRVWDITRPTYLYLRARAESHGQPDHGLFYFFAHYGHDGASMHVIQHQRGIDEQGYVSRSTRADAFQHTSGPNGTAEFSKKAFEGAHTTTGYQTDAWIGEALASAVRLRPDEVGFPAIIRWVDSSGDHMLQLDEDWQKSKIALAKP